MRCVCVWGCAGFGDDPIVDNQRGIREAEGYLSLPWTSAGDLFTWSAGTAGLDPASIARAADVTHGSMNLAGAVFVVGHVFGTIVLGLAMWRSHIVGRWAAVAVMVSQPIHFVAAIIVPNHTLDLIGWVILRMRDDDWQPLP